MRSKDYKAEMQMTLDEWDAKIIDLRKKAERLSGEKREELIREIEGIVAKKQALEERIEKAKQASVDNWDEIMEGFQHAAKDLQSSLDSAKNK